MRQDGQEVKIVITKEAHQKLSYYIEECPVEISGFGKVRELEPDGKVKKFEVYDVEILKQEATGGDASISEEDLSAFIMEKMKSKQSVEAYKCWWHSHADFAAFFSGTDEATIDGSIDFPYLISLVGNKKGEILGRLDTYKPIRLTFEADVMIERDDNVRLRNKIKKEIEEKVTIKHANMGFTRTSDSWDDDIPKKDWFKKEHHMRTPLDRFLESQGYSIIDNEDEEDEDNIVRHKTARRS